MSIYRVKQFCRTVATILVEAETEEQAEQIAQQDRIYFGKDEVLEIEYTSEKVLPAWPETVYTQEGQYTYKPKS